MENDVLFLVDLGNGDTDALPASGVGAQFLARAPLATPADPVLRTAAERFDGKASIGHTAAPDANYLARSTDTQIGFASLTAARIVVLPDVDTYPLGQTLFIVDESSQCWPERPILIVVGARSGDTTGGQGGIRIEGPWKGVALCRGLGNLWIIKDRTVNGIADVPQLAAALSGKLDTGLASGFAGPGKILQFYNVDGTGIPGLGVTGTGPIIRHQGAAKHDGWTYRIDRYCDYDPTYKPNGSLETGVENCALAVTSVVKRATGEYEDCILSVQRLLGPGFGGIRNKAIFALSLRETALSRCGPLQSKTTTRPKRAYRPGPLSLSRPRRSGLN